MMKTDPGKDVFSVVQSRIVYIYIYVISHARSLLFYSRLSPCEYCCSTRNSLFASTALITPLGIFNVPKPRFHRRTHARRTLVEQAQEDVSDVAFHSRRREHSGRRLRIRAARSGTPSHRSRAKRRDAQGMYAWPSGCH